MENARVVHIDNDPHERKVIKHLLRSAGHDVIKSCEDRSQAIEFLDFLAGTAGKGFCDFILSDGHLDGSNDDMPDGWYVVEHAKYLELPQPVILLSHDPDLIRQGIADHNVAKENVFEVLDIIENY